MDIRIEEKAMNIEKGKIINTKYSRKFKILPYLGLPIICLALFLLYREQMDWINMLWCELLIIFGYIATVIDLRERIVPNKLVLAMVTAWVITVVPIILINTAIAIKIVIGSVLGLLIGGGLLGLFKLIHVLRKNESIGSGDVKFMAAAGLYLGFAGAFSVMLYGSFLVFLAGIILWLMKKVSLKSELPFIPFLYIGILISIFLRS
jgi:prepilin signal peptidase PulO-like enzyme (type II secretory pathway)